jgi:hypothetical protein
LIAAKISAGTSRFNFAPNSLVQSANKIRPRLLQRLSRRSPSLDSLDLKIRLFDFLMRTRAGRLPNGGLLYNFHRVGQGGRFQFGFIFGFGFAVVDYHNGEDGCRYEQQSNQSFDS